MEKSCTQSARDTLHNDYSNNDYDDHYEYYHHSHRSRHQQLVDHTTLFEAINQLTVVVLRTSGQLIRQLLFSAPAAN